MHRSVEENIVVFDDNHAKSPEPLNEESISEGDKSSQVHTDTGSVQVMVNHQQTTDIINAHSNESSHTNQSEQSLGEKSPDNVSDKKLIESSNEEDGSSVLGLRFTGVMDEQSENEINKNTEEDGDLLEDNLEYVNLYHVLIIIYFSSSSELLSTSTRGSKYVVDSQEDGNEDESKDEDLENNFRYLFLLRIYTSTFCVWFVFEV